jgi:hypothetical protein
MMYSNILAVINPSNVDGNTIQELAEAVNCVGGTVVEIDHASNMIEAIIPSDEISTISAMEGVSYVRPVFSYFAPLTPAAA